jgi:hypothetical protein
MFVYIIVNQENNKIYIGKTITQNLQSYLRGKINDALGGKYNGRSHLFRAMAKYPSYVWDIHPLISTLKTDEDLCFWERVLIAQYDSQNPDVGYNICNGGQGGRRGVPLSEETKKLMGLAHRANGDRPSAEAHAKSMRIRQENYKQQGIWPGAPLNDMIGKVINGVSILKRLENNKDGDAAWSCRCHCGKTFKAFGSDLRSGHTRSCGCLKISQNSINLASGTKAAKEARERKRLECIAL